MSAYISANYSKPNIIKIGPLVCEKNAKLKTMCHVLNTNQNFKYI